MMVVAETEWRPRKTTQRVWMPRLEVTDIYGCTFPVSAPLVATGQL